jgi:cytochrome b
MNKKIGAVFVWPLCTRIIHWMIALSFFIAFYTSFFHDLFKWHLAFGWIFGIGLAYRLIWGLIGPNYATFRTFKLNPRELKAYFAEKIHNRWRKIYAGHNAASSWFTLIVLGFGLSIVLSGLILQGTQEASGLLGFLNTNHYKSSFALFYLHEILAYILGTWAFVHIVGVLIEQFYHKTHMVFAMLTGYKKAQGEDTVVSIWHHLFAYTVIGVSMLTLYMIVYQENTFFTRERFAPMDYASQNASYAQKCSKCHKNYPPFMLPMASWMKVMDGLDNHFGEEITDRNISKSEQQSIRDYLITHSAETSSRKLAFRTLDSLGEMRPVSMTKVPYWRDAHEHIDRSVFKKDAIKNASNCFACHEGFEYGILDNTRIDIPH